VSRPSSVVERSVAPRRPRVRPASATGPSVDPRFTARRAAVVRRDRRWRLIVAIGVATLVVLGGAAWPLTHSPLFAARALTVRGSQHTPAAVVLAAAGLAQHPPLGDVNVGASAAAIESLPWVAHASVVRHWPDAVVVTVTERRPVAVVASASGGWALVDRTGRVLSHVSMPPSGSVQLVSDGNAGRPGSTLRGAAAPLRVTASLPTAFASLVSAVAPTTGGGIDFSLSDGIGVIFGSPTQLEAKFEDVAAVLAGAQLVAGSIIDVSVPDAPTVTVG
jgi:cell division protein FtsQ